MNSAYCKFRDGREMLGADLTSAHPAPLRLQKGPGKCPLAQHTRVLGLYPVLFRTLNMQLFRAVFAMSVAVD